VNQLIQFIIASPFFSPEPISTGKYNGYLAHGLAERGHTVTVLCSHPLYPQWRPRRTTSSLPGVTVVRGGERMRYPSKPVLRRAVLELWFALFIASARTPKRARNTVVLSILPPSLFSAAIRLRFPHARHVAIVHDLQHVYASNAGNRLLGRIITEVEARLFRQFDRLIFLSEAMRNRACRDYCLDRERTRVFYPFATVSAAVLAASGGKRRLEALFPAAMKHVVYSGALGEKQNPDSLLAFFAYAAFRLPNVIFHVFSTGPTFDRLGSRYRATERVRFHSLVSESDLAELYERSSVQVVPQLLGTSEGSLPSKLPNLLVAGVPVLAICDPLSEIEQLAQLFRQLVCSNSWDFAHLFERLEYLLRIPPRPNDDAQSLFSLDRLISELEKDC
jgi:glycosyltransferase involved in cell wall biosynthesis